jgi:prepilin-type N-terminal cleavage/methylation domain-containing protein
MHHRALPISRQAFTLVELLIVIAIIGLLSTVAVVALSQSGVRARNQQRKANLIQISKALELYYSFNGAYPVCGGGCWGTTDNTWIPGLAPTFMAKLPIDPNHAKTNQSSAFSYCRTDASINRYQYISNGVDYKIFAYCTPEGVLSANDPFYDPMYPAQSWKVSTPGGNIW